MAESAIELRFNLNKENYLCAFSMDSRFGEMGDLGKLGMGNWRIREIGELGKLAN